MLEFSIQELSDKSSLPRRTIHFYVQQGLLPPPVGAGITTRYNEIHLLSLHLIPLLRRKGMKLDDIRGFLKDKKISDLRAIFENEQQSSPAIPALLPTSQPFAHYQLPAGISIIVPANIPLAERKKLTELLKAANEIFSK